MELIETAALDDVAGGNVIVGAIIGAGATIAVAVISGFFSDSSPATTSTTT